MTTEQIQKRADLEVLKYSTAKSIREQLDTARQAAEAAGDDADEFQEAILELVTEEG